MWSTMSLVSTENLVDLLTFPFGEEELGLLLIVLKLYEFKSYLSSIVLDDAILFIHFFCTTCLLLKFPSIFRVVPVSPTFTNQISRRKEFI